MSQAVIRVSVCMVTSAMADKVGQQCTPGDLRHRHLTGHWQLLKDIPLLLYCLHKQLHPSLYSHSRFYCHHCDPCREPCEWQITSRTSLPFINRTFICPGSGHSSAIFFRPISSSSLPLVQPRATGATVRLTCIN